MSTPLASKLPVVVLISGSGSNLQAIIDAAARPDAPYFVRLVVSNKASAFGLQRAAKAGIATAVLSHKDFDSREAFDLALQDVIDQAEPGLVALAGFMRILSSDFVRHYEGRMLNIHPSLLPKFKGLNTHQRAIDEGESEHGASVHFVSPELDAGPIILQARVPVLADDDAETLAARVLEQEHNIYPQAVTWFAEGRLREENGQALLDGQPCQL